MKTLLYSGKSWVLAAILVGLSTVVSYAQSTQGSRTPIYNPKTETAVTGTIQGVKEIPGPTAARALISSSRPTTKCWIFMSDQPGI